MSTFDFEPIDPARTGLSPEAIAVAEGWSILPSDVQQALVHFIDLHMTRLVPMLRNYYLKAQRPDQIRADCIAQRVTHGRRNGKAARSKGSKPRRAA